ncbi:SPFH domain, Band 7 family protein [Syntrophobotulus glycolicus DSM 8271]|uniref:SPFH domain, Band 7 family protein n=1 Tax=Syntrophobotulus glycolicus (strain DSM 8271 / FlGlyR) TaxID=645991 RepID=F0T1I4_SYNGF|nr:prohibitin family protein [Syntrophobotulus glycolicus]ADY56325.1 SPFH domain, Band 7 family protein [Syntrophobotulus glycolicus DSM 8271]
MDAESSASQPKIPRFTHFKGKLIKFVILLVLIALIIAGMIFKAYTIIPPGHRGTVVQLGAVSSRILSEGFHFKVPFIQEIIPMDVRMQKIESDHETSSKDLQVVHATVAVNYSLDPEKVNVLYQNIPDYASNVVTPEIRESLKSVIAQYTAEELVSKRAEVSAKVKDVLREKLSNYYMILHEVNLTELKFSDQFDQAIEQKQIAEQQALKAKLDLQRVQVEAQQKLEQAKAEAEALKIQKDYVTPELVKLRQVEAQLEAIKKWDGKLPAVNGSNVFPFINMDGSGFGTQTP